MPKKGYKQTEEHRRVHRKFTKDQEKEIEKQYREEKVSLYTLARRNNCSNTGIKNVIIRSGGNTRILKESVNTKSCKRLRRQNNSTWKGKMKGDKNPMFGVHRSGEKAPFYNQRHSEETKIKMRKPKSEEVKIKMSISAEGKHVGEKHGMFGVHRFGKDNPMFGKHQSEASKKKNREKALLRIQTHHGPYKDTKPELKMENILVFLNIPYEKQFRIGNHLADFHFLNTNILVEVDGDYFHGNPEKFSNLTERQLNQKERDIKNEQIAKEKGFTVLRFWESDILSNEKKIKEKICNIVNL